MGEARRRKQAGDTEPNPNYQKRKRIKQRDLGVTVANSAMAHVMELLAGARTRGGYPKWK